MTAPMTREELAKHLECSEKSILRLSGRAMPMKLNATERDMIVAALRAGVAQKPVSEPCETVTNIRTASEIEGERLARKAAARAQEPSVGVLHDIYITMRHARTFITSREKMHPTGVELWDRLFAQVEALQLCSVPSTTLGEV